MIVRGTTPHYTFILPMFDEDITKGVITFSQNKVSTFSKNITASDIEVVDEHYEVQTSLTQNETLSFKYYGVPSKDCVNIQIKLLLDTNDVCASDVMKDSVGKTLYGEVLV